MIVVQNRLGIAIQLSQVGFEGGFQNKTKLKLNSTRLKLKIELSLAITFFLFPSLNFHLSKPCTKVLLFSLFYPCLNSITYFSHQMNTKLNCTEFSPQYEKACTISIHKNLKMWSTYKRGDIKQLFHSGCII